MYNIHSVLSHFLYCVRPIVFLFSNTQLYLCLFVLHKKLWETGSRVTAPLYTGAAQPLRTQFLPISKKKKKKKVKVSLWWKLKWKQAVSLLTIYWGSPTLWLNFLLISLKKVDEEKHAMYLYHLYYSQLEIDWLRCLNKKYQLRLQWEGLNGPKQQRLQNLKCDWTVLVLEQIQTQIQKKMQI